MAGSGIAIGIDIGGSGIKAASARLATGDLASERLQIATPKPSTPEAVIETVTRLVDRIADETEGEIETVGVGIPSVVLDGVTKTAANIDPGWIDFDAAAALSASLARPVVVVNDADAAGVAEMQYGAGVGRMGTVVMLTLGTGVGSALFSNGHLVPNLELGHMEIRGVDAERRSAAAARLRRGLSWEAWAADLDEHLHAIDRLLWPDLFILGGGVSRRAEMFVPRLTVRPPVVAATLENDAGIVGAAMFAAERTSLLTAAASKD